MNSHQFRRSGPMSVCGGLAAASALWIATTAVHAGSYDVTKIVTWDVTQRRAGNPPPPNVETVGDNTGKWRYAEHVFAGDKHNEAAHDHKDNQPQNAANPKV